MLTGNKIGPETQPHLWEGRRFKQGFTGSVGAWAQEAVALPRACSVSLGPQLQLPPACSDFVTDVSSKNQDGKLHHSWSETLGGILLTRG